MLTGTVQSQCSSILSSSPINPTTKPSSLLFLTNSAVASIKSFHSSILSSQRASGPSSSSAFPLRQTQKMPSVPQPMTQKALSYKPSSYCDVTSEISSLLPTSVSASTLHTDIVVSYATTVASTMPCPSIGYRMLPWLTPTLAHIALHR